MDGLMDRVDREQVLVTGEICFPVQDRAHLLMGLDNFCMAAVDQPDRVAALLHRIADYQIGIVRRYLAMGADIIRGLDDYGGQQALLLGPRLWRKLIKPELARIIRAAKACPGRIKGMAERFSGSTPAAMSWRSSQT